MARIFTAAGGQALIGAASQLHNLSSFSVAFWLFRTATAGAERNLIAAYSTGGWVISLTLTTNLINAYYTFATSDKIRVSSTSPTLNTWMHVVVTHENRGFANTDFLFYFNGKQEAGTSSTTGAGAKTGAAALPLTVGSDAGTGFLAPPAHIGPIAIWRRAIGPSECLALAGGAHPLRFREGLQEFFDMNTEHGEQGWINNTYLVRSATNPSSASVNPPMESIPRQLTPPPQMSRNRFARYFVPSVGFVSDDDYCGSPIQTRDEGVVLLVA